MPKMEQGTMNRRKIITCKGPECYSATLKEKEWSTTPPASWHQSVLTLFGWCRSHRSSTCSQTWNKEAAGTRTIRLASTILVVVHQQLCSLTIPAVVHVGCSVRTPCYELLWITTWRKRRNWTFQNPSTFGSANDVSALLKGITVKYERFHFSA